MSKKTQLDFVILMNAEAPSISELKSTNTDTKSLKEARLVALIMAESMADKEKGEQTEQEQSYTKIPETMDSLTGVNSPLCE